MEIRNNALLASPEPYTTILGNNNNLDFRGTLIVVTTNNNNDVITGLIPFSEGHWVELINLSDKLLVISHNDSNSAVGNRFNTNTQQNINLKQFDFVRAFYINGAWIAYKVESNENKFITISSGTYTIVNTDYQIIVDTVPTSITLPKIIDVGIGAIYKIFIQNVPTSINVDGGTLDLINGLPSYSAQDYSTVIIKAIAPNKWQVE